MAHTVYLGSFNKRLNSTKQPTYSGWALYSCNFKEETSLIRPTIRLSADFATFSSSHFNYAYMLGRYYWIGDIRSVRSGYIEVDMAVDVLATCKSAIQSTNAFIEYGFNTFDAGDSSTRFPDTRVPVNENPITYVANFDPSNGLISPLTGCYTLQAVGAQGGLVGHNGLATFVLTGAEMRRLLRDITHDLPDEIDQILQNTSSAQDVMNYLTAFSLKQELLNESAMAAIQSVKWLPLDISGATGTPQNIYLGKYDTGVQALMLDNNSTVSQGNAIDIPWPADDWRRNNCQLSLYIPFFGTIPIPIDQSLNTTSIGVQWTAEYFSGSISVVVRTSNGAYTVYAASTNIAVDMGVGRSQVGASQLLGGGLQMLGGALQMAGGAIDLGTSVAGGIIGAVLGTGGGGGVAGALGSITGGAQQAFQGYAQTVQPTFSCAGCMGGMAAIAQVQTGILSVIYYPPIDLTNFQAKYGHPVFKLGTPASGFCKTRGFSVSLAEPGPMAAMINSMMDGGVFIE